MIGSESAKTNNVTFIGCIQNFVKTVKEDTKCIVFKGSEKSFIFLK